MFVSIFLTRNEAQAYTGFRYTEKRGAVLKGRSILAQGVAIEALDNGEKSKSPERAFTKANGYPGLRFVLPTVLRGNAYPNPTAQASLSLSAPR